MRVLVLDDSEAIRGRVVNYLQQLGGEAEYLEAATEREALNAANDQNIDIALLDIQLVEGNGINVLRLLRQQGSTARIIMFSNFSSTQIRKLCLEYGADAFYDKSKEMQRAASDVISHLLHRRYVS